MVYKGVIFDLDGTLADTLSDIANSVNRILKKNDFPTHPVSEYKLLVGRGLESLVTYSLPEGYRDGRVITACLNEMIEDYRNNCLVETRLYAGIESLLRDLLYKGFKLAVYSNKADELTQTIVFSLMPGIDFEMVLGARPDVPKKPDPAGAILISNKMGIQPGNILYLGDSDVDMITAKKAGMLAVGVLWGFRSRRELQENGADVLIESPGELSELIRNEFGRDI